jgi:protein-tyrosine phosphatase
MIDFHCHLLPGLDDGPESVDEALVMARALAAFGFREVHCTPHCIAGQYEISPVEVREAVRKLQARLDLEGIALTLRTGMEYYLDEYFERFAANLLPLGESQLVLCEAPPQAPPGLVGEMAALIVVQGFIPLMAHPERSEPVWQMLTEEQESNTRYQGEGRDPCPSLNDESAMESRPWWRRLFSRSPNAPANDSSLSAHRSARVSSVLPEETLYQANLGAFVGYYGPLAQRRAYELLKRGVYSCFASDLHEARAAAELLEQAQEKLAFNPVLRKLGDFKPPQGQGGDGQLGFW